MAYERALLKTFGNESETLATRYLEDAGYVIVERNFYARKLGEIDIIAQKDGTLHFIEVKSGRADFDPVYNMTASKIRKVINSAWYYLKSKHLDTSFTIDALIIRKGSVELIENITL
jgi:putative endonuclease